MKIVCISDTHEKWQKVEVPECDILISAGDYSFRGEPQIVRDFHAWLNIQPAKHIVSVQGNHECWVEKEWASASQIAHDKCPRAIFISEGRFEIEGIKIYCSATTPMFYNWAFMKEKSELEEHWKKIPADTELLVTHGPPYGIRDTSPMGVARSDPNEHLGCIELAKRIADLKKLRMHVFGHIHGGSGVEQIGQVTYVNAAICDEFYKPTNPPRIIGWK